MDRDRYIHSARALLLVCLGLHVAAMFPSYFEPGTAVLTTSQQTAEFICLDIGWALALALTMSRPLVPSGVALGLGLGAVEIGFLVSDVSTSFLISNGAPPGHWLAVAGLMAGFAGLLLAASSLPLGAPQPARANRPRLLAGLCVAVVAVAAYFPNWESGVAKAYSGNAFLQPGGILAGAMISGLLLGFVVVAGCLWQPGALGAWAIAGAAIALVSQLVSAYFQAEQFFPSSALQPGRHVSLSGYWTADAAAVVAMFALALWALAAAAMPAPAPPGTAAAEETEHVPAANPPGEGMPPNGTRPAAAGTALGQPGPATGQPGTFQPGSGQLPQPGSGQLPQPGSGQPGTFQPSSGSGQPPHTGPGEPAPPPGQPERPGTPAAWPRQYHWQGPEGDGLPSPAEGDDRPLTGDQRSSGA